MKTYHMTKEALAFILRGVPLSRHSGHDERFGIVTGTNLESACGVSGIFWITKSSKDKQGCIAIQGYEHHDDPFAIMKGYEKINCPKCIEILKKNGL